MNDERKDEAGYHTILVAIVVQAPTREQAETSLYDALPEPGRDEPGYPSVDCWWIAEDDRRDRSDNDSAVFVPKGGQAYALNLFKIMNLLAEAGAEHEDQRDGTEGTEL